MRPIELGMFFGPVPVWEAPLWKKIVLLVAIIVCSMMLPGSSRKAQAPIGNIIRFAIGILLISAMVALFR
jgi:hypothetical protein